MEFGTNAGVTATNERWFRHSVSHDIEEHTRQQQDWEQNYDQLDCGVFHGDFVDLRCSGIQFFTEHTTRAIRESGRLTPSSLGFCVPLASNDVIYRGMHIPPRSLLVAPANAEVDLCTPADCTLVGTIIDATVFREAMLVWRETPDWLREITELGAFKPTPEVVQYWLGSMRTVAQAAQARPELLASEQARRQLHDGLLMHQLQLLASAVPTPPSGKEIASKRLVDRACELVLSGTSEPISLLEVCRIVGASPRKLGYCFQQTLGMSPGKFIKITRLNAVRRELTQAKPGSSVYDAAVRWGFWHFGHFSIDYKKQFSESPSETLRRSTGLRQAA